MGDAKTQELFVTTMIASAYINAPRGDLMRNPGTAIFDDDETSCRSDATTVVIANRLPRSPEEVSVYKIHNGKLESVFLPVFAALLVFS